MSHMIKTATRWLFFISLIFFISGLLSLFRSKPQLDVVPVAAGDFRYPGPQKQRPVANVANIASPFSPEMEAPAGMDDGAMVDSQLILFGTLAGENPRAIVAEKADPTVTHIVKLGDEIAGEKVMTIGKGFIEVMAQGRKIRVEQ
ncbi:MAG TPA: hypothetical protein GX391_09545 [Firmicutes bacterium]|jgi:hypothetical protein|nr:hypothetical protein [Bacillota bacterium]HOQ24662.1 hypothetical protein [Bacillota bacterium]HPT68166.1 hypothetical protein [Bacillota bacterium]